MEIAKLKIPLAATGGLLASRLGHVWPLILLVFAAIMLDYITGMLAGRANEGINSRRAVKGVYKKTGFIILMVLGFLLDTSFNYFIAAGFSTQLPFDLPIGLIISAWIVVTEAISVCENLERMGVPIPDPLLKLLRKTRGKIDGGDVNKEQ